MLPPLRALLAAVTRLRPRPKWWLGAPLRATIAAVAPRGYVLLMRYTQGTEWVSLPTRYRGDEWLALSTRCTDDRPDEREFAAIAAALAARRLARTEPWSVDTDGRLFAPIAVIRPGKERA